MKEETAENYQYKEEIEISTLNKYVVVRKTRFSSNPESRLFRSSGIYQIESAEESQ